MSERVIPEGRVAAGAILCAACLATGCVVDSQRFTRRPDGSHTMSVRTWSVGMNAAVAGMRSDWQTEDAIYGDSVSNLNTVVETRLVDAVAEGVVRGLKASGGLP